MAVDLPGKGLVRTDCAFANNNDFTGFDAADEIGADNIERDGFRSKYDRFTQTTHYQRTNAKRVATRNHAFGRHANQRIGTLDLFQRINQPVKQALLRGGCDKMDDDFGVRS